MRPFLVLLLAAWLSGLVLGVLWGWHPATLMAGGITLVWLSRTYQSYILAATLGLLFLGISYGGVETAEKVLMCDSEIQMGRVEAVRIEQERIQYRVRSEEGCLLLVNGSRFPSYAVGSVLQISGGSLKAPDDFDEEFSGYASYLEREGIDLVWSFPTIVLVEKSSQSSLQNIRAVLLQRVDRLFSEPAASVVGAMVLARRGTLSDELLEPFRRTGTAHVLAISGLHVGLLAGMMWLLVRRLPLNPWLRAGIVLLLLWLYIILIGGPISSQRAGIFITLVIIALRLQLLVSLPTVLLVAVTGLLSFNPQLLFDVGFQLSVSAVTGIWLTLFLLKPYRRHIVSRALSIWERFAQSGIDVLLVSFGAALGTWPLIAYHFGVVSPVSVVANLFIVPVVGILLLCALLTLVVSFLAWPIAFVLSFLVSQLVRWILFAATFFSTWNLLVYEGVTIPSWLVGTYYSAMLLLALLMVRWQLRSWREVWE